MIDFLVPVIFLIPIFITFYILKVIIRKNYINEAYKGNVLVLRMLLLILFSLIVVSVAIYSLAFEAKSTLEGVLRFILLLPILAFALWGIGMSIFSPASTMLEFAKPAEDD